MAGKSAGPGLTLIYRKLLILGLIFAFVATPLSSFTGADITQDCNPALIPNEAMDSIYYLNARRIDAGASIDGSLGDPVWSHPDVARAHTQDFSGYMLTVGVFFNDTSVVISAQLFGDSAQNPNDWCAVCFDSDFSGGAAPSPGDIKLVAKNTKDADDYELFHGNGSGWSIYSNAGGSPNPWPPGYTADAEIDTVATYEFTVPLQDVWSEGKLAGFMVHAFNQAGNKHVWWPDASYDGVDPPSDPCNDPSGYGEIIYNAPQVPRTKTLYLHDDGAYATPDDWELMNTSLPRNPINVNYENGGWAGIRINRATDPTISNRFQTWNLTPPLASNLHITGNVNLTVWTRCNVVANQTKNMTFALMNSNGTKISTGYYNRSVWPTTFFKTNITIPVTNYTIVKGHYLWLNISRTDITGQSNYLMFDNDTCPSHLNLTTDSYVDVNWTKCFDFDWTETYDYDANEAIRVLSNLTDPFGSFDIVNATINVTGPGGATLVTTRSMSHMLTDASNPSAWKLYNYNITTPRPWGMYRINVTAWESNGVTQMRSVFFNVTGVILTADHLAYVSGDDQNAPAGTDCTAPITFQVHDQTNVPVPGALVNFTVYSVPAATSGYYFNESGNPWCVAISDASGHAHATLHLGTKPGNYWVNVSCTYLGLGGPTYNSTINATARTGPADHLVYVSGTGSSAAVGQPVPPFRARVVDACGNNVTGSRVWWNVSVGAGWGLSNATSVSGSGGQVSTTLTLGPTPGWYNFTCANSSLPGSPESVPFESQAVVGVPYSVDISANLTAVQVQKTVALTIWVNDSYGNVIPGQSVSLSFVANPSGAFLTAVSEGGGVYSATYTAGQTAWVMDTVRASCSGKEDTVSINVQAGVPSDLVYVSGNGQQDNASHALNAQFVVQALDAYGNVVPGTPVTWAIATFPAGATGQTLLPTSNATDASGLSGARMTLGSLPGLYNATATSISVPGDTVTFSAECLALPTPTIQVYSIAMIGSDGQVGSISSKLANAFIVEVRNQTGAIASGVNVWFNVTAGGGHLDNSNVTTSATGRAQTFLTLGPSTGINTVSAEISSTGTSSVSFYAIGTAPEISVALASNLTSLVTGGSMVFILTYNNIGTEVAKNVWLNFTMPAYLNYNSDSSGVTPVTSQNRLTWLFQTSAVGPHSFVMLCRLDSQASASFACHFEVNYSSQSGIRLPAVTSNTVTVDVLQEAGNNIPPIIDGVPDLIVHYDWDYMIDLTPYIFDPDNSESELSLILSDNVNVRVNTTRNLAIVLNYSHDLLGIPQLLNITVSDGLGSDWDVITITVSDDFPPEMVDSMPDVAFDEDLPCYGFNITHYFFDRDGDSLYYTYGQRHLTITILANYTVLFRGQQDWFGQERITFRALDPTGALIEDTILVTVRPVNDAPVTTAVPDQAGLVNVSWVLDLSPYISDVDNTMSQLTLTVDSDYATINGLNITFRCATPLNDILTITVSDGAAQAYIQISILVEAPPVTPDSFPSWVLPPLIIILAIISLLLVLAARRKPVIEQAFLIYKDGALLAHTTNRMIPDMDSQIFSSMFTAIQDFIKDSFKDEKNWSLNRIEFGENKIFVAKGREGLFSLALVYKGRDKGLQNISKKAIETIDKKYGKELKDWDGNMDHFRGVRDVLSDSIFK